MTRTSRRVRPAGQRVLAWLTLTAFVATSCGGRRTPTGPVGGGVFRDLREDVSAFFADQARGDDADVIVFDDFLFVAHLINDFF